MKITFLIGNGFDLAVGMKTKYTDFYKSYINDKTQDDLLISMIKQDYDSWSDLEVGLGKCLENVAYDNRDGFLESKFNLEIALAEYLENEETLFDYKLQEENIAKSFSETFNTFLDNLPRTEKEKVMNTIMSAPIENLYFDFISFNYTKVLDKCINIIKNNNKLLKSYYGEKRPIIGDVFHVHGSTDLEMILGVNDESQICNPIFSQDMEFNDLMIKYNLNTSIAQNKIAIAEQIMNVSAVVVIFGMSIGETDNYWWNFLVKWLSEAEFRKVIIFTHEDEDNKRKNPYRTIINRNRILNMFFERSQADEKIQEKLKKQIMIVKNPNNVFSINIADRNYDMVIENANEVASTLETV